jgi:8-oxo-dGTP pyrophosphatase MutT (NUDIX family)
VSAEDRRFEKLDERVIHDGRIVDLVIGRFRYADGEEVEREIVRHQGAVGVVVHDDADVFLVRQPRETIGDPDFLEIPAGRLDVDGEAALHAAQRELAEEIGKEAEDWEEIERFFTSPGFTDEQVILYAAGGLRDATGTEPDPGERIEIVEWPLDRLDDAIAECRDSKSLIGLMWLRLRLERA